MKASGQVSDCGLGKKRAAVPGSGAEEFAGSGEALATAWPSVAHSDPFGCAKLPHAAKLLIRIRKIMEHF